jgi:phage terminase large subunit-like protein
VLVIDGALGTVDDRWAAFEVGCDVSRQNGKGGILEARELAGLFAFGERMIIHSAHQFDTSLEAFRRLLFLIEDTPDFDRQVKRVSRSHGEEGVELRSGQRIRFRTRTKGGGRGFTGDCLLLDEAMFLPEATIGALLPTLSARPNPQVWYTGSAVDQTVHDHGSVFARARRRGIAREPRIAFYEWSAGGEIDDLGDRLDDTDAWREANPALGIRISEDHVRSERRAMDSRTFAVERLGIGDWPADPEDQEFIAFEQWRRLADKQSMLVDPVCLAFDVTPSRDRATISAGGRRLDGLLHVETVDHRRGTGWVVDRFGELVQRHQVFSVSCDPAGPAAALIRPLENIGITVEQVTAREYAQACGMLFDLIADAGLRHLGSDELATAVKNAGTRPLGESWAWSRRTSAADISPLVAATLAVWQASAKLHSVYDDRGILTI